MPELDMHNKTHVETFKAETLEILRVHQEKMDKDEDLEPLSFTGLREALKKKFLFKGGGTPKIVTNDAFFNAKFKDWAADYKKRLRDLGTKFREEYWGALNIKSAVRHDHSSSAVVGAKEQAVKDWSAAAALLRKYEAWREPEVVNGDELKLGGHLEDGAGRIVETYKCADVANEKKLWAATSVEEAILKRECALLALREPNLVAACLVPQPGQSAVDLLPYVSERLRAALAKHDEFAQLRGAARAFPVHVRTGKARLAFSGVSQDDEKDAGEERLSVLTDLATSHHAVRLSKRTTAERKRKPLPTYEPGQDVKTGVQCWDEEDKSSRVGYCDGVVAYVSGGYDLDTGEYVPAFARFQTTIDERTDGTPEVVYSPAAADVLNKCDTGLGAERVTSWGSTVVNRRECSIGGALLCVACGVGGLFSCVRTYHVKAFETWPYLLANEMYNRHHIIELDTTLEIVYILEAFYGVKVRFSGASREDSDDAAFDIIMESNDPLCPIVKLRERPVVGEIKSEWAKLLREKLRAGHGHHAVVESDGEDTDPGEEEQSTGRPVEPKKVDVTISLQASQSQRGGHMGLTLFGPGGSEAAASMRHERQKLVEKYMNEDSSLLLRDAMQRAQKEMWQKTRYGYRIVVCAAAHLDDESKKPSYFDVNPKIEQDPAAEIVRCFNAEIALNDAATNCKHDGEAEHATKKLDVAELPVLRAAQSDLIAAIDAVPGQKTTPHGAPWTKLVKAIKSDAADAETAKADALLPKTSDRAFFNEWDRRTDEFHSQDLEKLRKRIEHKLGLAAKNERRESEREREHVRAKKRATSGSEAAPKKKKRPAKKTQSAARVGRGVAAPPAPLQRLDSHDNYPSRGASPSAQVFLANDCSSPSAGELPKPGPRPRRRSCDNTVRRCASVSAGAEPH